jgi:hypothetical protein
MDIYKIIVFLLSSNKYLIKQYHFKKKKKSITASFFFRSGYIFSWLQTLAEKTKKNIDILSLKNITEYWTKSSTNLDSA